MIVFLNPKLSDVAHASSGGGSPGASPGLTKREKREYKLSREERIQRWEEYKASIDASKPRPVFNPAPVVSVKVQEAVVEVDYSPPKVERVRYVEKRTAPPAIIPSQFGTIIPKLPLPPTPTPVPAEVPVPTVKYEIPEEEVQKIDREYAKAMADIAGIAAKAANQKLVWANELKQKLALEAKRKKSMDDFKTLLHAEGLDDLALLL